MILPIKIALLTKGIRQTRMASELGWDPAKLSRIINETLSPSSADRAAISMYLSMREAELFSATETSMS